MFRSLLPLVGALLLSLAVGCTTSKPAADAPSMVPTKAIVITGGNGGATAVIIPGDKPGEVAVLASGDMKACAQCKADAIKYFQTGELVAKCPVCGATRTPLSSVAIEDSHAHN